MRYSIEPRDKGKNLSNNYGQKIFDTSKKSANEALKIASKKAVQKTTEATGDLIGKKISDKITSIPNKTVKELPINNEDVGITTRKKRYISPEERQQIIDELRLVLKNY